MQERIELLDADMMKKYKDKLKFIEYWAKVSGAPIGWHYWLDFIWILSNLEEISLPRDAWIMDAGAGNGLLQFMLASLGYNIISLDYAERDVPSTAARIFDITEKRYPISNPEHFYRKFIHHEQTEMGLTPRRVIRALFRPDKAARYFFNKLTSTRFAFLLNLVAFKEVVNARFRKKSYGKIIYALGDFACMKGFGNESVDCIVSVSALEHGSKEDIKKTAREFDRVLKKDSFMFLTLSGAEEKDWFFEPCQGWCFTEDTLKEIFNLEDNTGNFKNYNDLFNRLKNSSEIKKRIPKIYFSGGNNGLPWGVYLPRYQPVGIVRRKRQVERTQE